LMNLYLVFAKALKAMNRYDLFKSIRLFNSLPEHHLNSCYVLGKLGRLNFEIVNYSKAEKYFLKLRNIDRTRLSEMEYYSTLLWHLHKEEELSFLAHELYDVNKNSPEAWITIGNLFSLMKEPDEAIKCFKRATQIDPGFAYAYTLQGHEHATNDSYENALDCFRTALLYDPRHYNALYGIGKVYLSLGDNIRAEYHFRKAVSINPLNVILICCVGMVLEREGKRELALKQYELAHEIQPLAPLALFKKAQLLFVLAKYQESVVEFEKLKEIAPDEATVHFLLAQLYKILHRKTEAVKEFTIALNLDPKGSHLIKEAMESLND
ncbi:TPR-like protein, partial [Ascoidea rubescens DSM 1968]